MNKHYLSVKFIKIDDDCVRLTKILIKIIKRHNPKTKAQIDELDLGFDFLNQLFNISKF